MILYFYPKDDTPGCTKEACSFRDSYEAFKDAGAEVVPGDLSDPASIQSAFEGAYGAYCVTFFWDHYAKFEWRDGVLQPESMARFQTHLACDRGDGQSSGKCSVDRDHASGTHVLFKARPETPRRRRSPPRRESG